MAKKKIAPKPRGRKPQKATKTLRPVDVPIHEVIREAVANYAARGLALHPQPMPTQPDTSSLIDSLKRVEDDLLLLAESLCEDEEPTAQSELARALGSLVTAKREAERIGGEL